MPQPIVLYSCAQQDLYNASKLLVFNLQHRLASFSAYKAKYDTAYCDEFTQKIDIAEALPDLQSRTANLEASRIILGENIIKALNLWQDMKGYITEAFTGSLQKPRLEEAGAHNYQKAATGNKAALRTLLLDAAQFITNHETDLTANNNMPVSFKAKMDIMKVDIEDQNTAIVNAEAGIKEATRTKIEANNEIFKLAATVCADGQRVFRDDALIKEEFVFERLCETVAPKLAGYKGSVIETVTNQPIVGVSVMSSDETHITSTDINGRFDFKGIAANTYTFAFIKDGYTTITKQVVIQPKVTKTETIELEVAQTVPQA
jgi:hypothetical protein